MVPDISVQNGIVYLSLKVTDESDVPARSYQLYIADIYNQTISVVSPIVNQTFSDLLGKRAELFGNDNHYLNISATNDLGTTVVYYQILNIPVLSEYLSMLVITSSRSHTLTPC